jgi:hypothetical protein
VTGSERCEASSLPSTVGFVLEDAAHECVRVGAVFRGDQQRPLETGSVIQSGQFHDAVEVTCGIQFVLRQQAFEEREALRELLQELLGEHHIGPGSTAAEWRTVLCAHDDGAFGRAQLVVGQNVALGVLRLLPAALAAGACLCAMCDEGQAHLDPLSSWLVPDGNSFEMTKCHDTAVTAAYGEAASNVVKPDMRGSF